MRPAPWSPLFLLLPACAPQFTSEQGELAFEADDIVTVPYGFTNGGPLVAGTALCPEVMCRDLDCSAVDADAGGDQVVIDSCFTQTVDGPAHLEDGCVVVDGAGAVDWNFEPDPSCPYRGVASASDVVHLEGVDADSVTAAFSNWPEDLAAAALIGDFPSDWTTALGEPRRVVAGVPQPVGIELRSGDVQVAWREGDVVALSAGSALPFAGGIATVEVAPGEAKPVTLSGPTYTADVGDVLGVDPADLTSLEIVAASYDAGDGAAPIAMRAVVRDSAGQVVWGAPVTWTLVEGDLVLAPVDTQKLGTDYESVGDTCLPPSVTQRSATIEARSGGLSDRVELTWTVAAAGADEDFTPDATCQSAHPGCGCETGGVGPQTAGLGVLGVLVARRRRSDPKKRR